MLYDQTWDELQRFLEHGFSYEDGCKVELHRDDPANYAVLYIWLHAPNTYRPLVEVEDLGTAYQEPRFEREDRYTRHEFVVPVATYDYVNWRRWVFERLCTAARHEVCEWFMDNGVRVFAPHHGAGEDPYVAWTPSGDDEIRQRKGVGQD